MNELKRQLELATEQLEQWIRDTQPIIGWRDTVTFAATKTLIADCKVALNRSQPDREAVIEEWRDAREVIFKTDIPTPVMWTRLGAAELALMTYARALKRSALSTEDSNG